MTFEDFQGLKAQDLVLDLKGGIALQGKVVDLKGRPVPGALVFLRTDSGGSPVNMSGLGVRASKDGTFFMGGIGFGNTPRELKVSYKGKWPPSLQAYPKGKDIGEERVRASAEFPIKGFDFSKNNVIDLGKIYLCLKPLSEVIKKPIAKTAKEEAPAVRKFRGVIQTRGHRVNIRNLFITAKVTYKGRPVSGARIKASPVIVAPDGTLRPWDVFSHIYDKRPSGPNGITYDRLTVSFTSRVPEDKLLIGIAGYHPTYGSAYKEVPYKKLKEMAIGELELPLKRRLVLKGIVVDRKGNSVPGAQVGLQTIGRVSYPGMAGLRVYTDQKGMFTIAGIGFHNKPTGLRVVYLSLIHI